MDHRLWPEMTVLDNVRVAHNYDLGYQILDVFFQTGRYRKAEAKIDRRAQETLEIMGLREHARELAKNLPYGLQRKVEIARALVARPQLLLLDEPSMGLAPFLMYELFRVLREINQQGTTILLVEQNARIALKYAHRGYVLETGKVVLEGPAKDLAHNEDIKKAYLGE
jgi:ABC-type branched-subunit amino acid transport system ATPase component